MGFNHVRFFCSWHAGSDYWWNYGLEVEERDDMAAGHTNSADAGNTGHAVKAMIVNVTTD